VQSHRDVELRHTPQVYITCMSRNHADCVGNYRVATLINTPAACWHSSG
jgi:hypothetical protein